MRRPYVAGNWKLWGTRAEASGYCERLLAGLPAQRDADLGLCVPYTTIETVADAAKQAGVVVSAQSMSADQNGAHTGEISAEMLLEVGANGVVLGHSERRQDNGETDRALQAKVPAALAAGLLPILCVGETEDEREAGDMERKLRHQVGEGLESVPDEQLPDIVIAYEPIWAIGTGRVATPDQAEEAVSFVRALIGGRSPSAAEQIRVLYGGSVKPDNAAEILAQPNVDGALVGGASLDPDGLLAILAAAG